jgi:hypothetical protein
MAAFNVRAGHDHRSECASQRKKIRLSPMVSFEAPLLVGRATCGLVGSPND